MKPGPDFINPGVKAFKAERECLKEEGIAALTKEFEKTIPQALKVFKQIADLKTVTEDARKMQDTFIRFFNVLPENITVLASEADFEKIVTHVKVDGEEKKESINYYQDANS